MSRFFERIELILLYVDGGGKKERGWRNFFGDIEGVWAGGGSAELFRESGGRGVKEKKVVERFGVVGAGQANNAFLRCGRKEREKGWRAGSLRSGSGRVKCP